MTDRSPHGDHELSQLHGKIDLCGVLKDLYKSTSELVNTRTSDLKDATEQLNKVGAKYQSVYSELLALKSTRHDLPELNHIIDDLEPLPGNIQEQNVQVACSGEEISRRADVNSLTELILTAAKDALHLEHRQEMLQVMLGQKMTEIESLKKKIYDNDINAKLLQERIDELNTDISKLKMNSLTRCVSCESTSSTEHTDDMITDPQLLRDKIDQLKQRIRELMNHNEKWNEICQNLKKQLEAANRQLVEYQLTFEQSLKEEREKTARAQAERDDALAQVERERELRHSSDELCRQLSTQVSQLEADVKELEEKLAKQEADANASMLQAETYADDFKNEHSDHERTKAQVKSLREQQQTAISELRNKELQLNKVLREKERLTSDKRRLENLLQQANIDRSSIEGQMGIITSGSNCSPELRESPTADPEHKFSIQLKEEELTKEKGWQCSKCTLINAQSAVCCEACHASRRSKDSRHRTSPSHGTGRKDPGAGQSGRHGILEEDGCHGVTSQYLIAVYY